MNRPLFGEVLAHRLFGECAGENGGGDLSSTDDGVGGTGVATVSAQVAGFSRRMERTQVGKVRTKDFFTR